MGLFGAQLKYVFRNLRRAPLFTIVALITIGLAIGANVAIFSVINGILLKALPYPDSGRLVGIWQKSAKLKIGPNGLESSPADYFNFLEENRTFQDLGLYTGDNWSVTGMGVPEEVTGIDVTSGTFRALGVQPALGRLFRVEDDQPRGAETVMLGYGYWQRKFGGDPSVIGREIRMDAKPRQIIGVLPKDFWFMDRDVDLVTPFGFDRGKTTLGNFSYQMIARLKPGVSIEQATADVNRMLPIVYTKFQPPPGFSAKIFEDAALKGEIHPLKKDVVGDLGKMLWILMASIGVVLLIACANVANLLLVRAESRQHEFAIRTALGAGSGRLSVELLSESVTLGIVGGAIGLGLAYWALRLLLVMAPANLPRLNSISIDAPVILFAIVISVFAGLVFGFIPVLKHAAPRVMTSLRAGGRTLSQSREAHRVRNTLVVLQMTLAVTLLVCSGLMIRTFVALRNVQPGFSHPEQIQTVRIHIPEALVKDTQQTLRLFQEVEHRISAIPGVSAVSVANSVPTDNNNSTDLIYAQDHVYRENQLPPLRRFKFVAPGFFAVLGTPLLAGRDITWADVYDKRHVTMVSENMARELWGSPQAALGKQIREGMKDSWREVIGVVADVHADGADQPAPSVVYWPILMDNFWGNDLFMNRGQAYAIRTNRAGSESLLKEIKSAIWSVTPDVPLTSVRTLKEIYGRSMARASFTLVMLAIAGAMALLLGIVGIYGVISYTVSQRTREIGIRIALGAQQGTLKGMVVRHGLMLASIGVGVGLIVAAGLTRLMSSLLFGITALDPLTYGAVSVVLIVAAMLASYIPAHRASVINPMEALRGD